MKHKDNAIKKEPALYINDIRYFFESRVYIQWNNIPSVLLSCKVVKLKKNYDWFWIEFGGDTIIFSLYREIGGKIFNVKSFLPINFGLYSWRRNETVELVLIIDLKKEHDWDYQNRLFRMYISKRVFIIELWCNPVQTDRNWEDSWE